MNTPSQLLLSRLSLTLSLLPPLLFCLSPIARAEEANGKKKIVFIAGNPSHGKGEHEHRAGCMLLADHLNKSGLAVETVVGSGGTTFQVVGTASVTVDTTAANVLDLIGTWSVANAGNVARLDAMTVEIIG